jgi:hypothetical protein
VELLPSAATAQRFLALEGGFEGLTSIGSFLEEEAPSRAQRNAAQNLAGQALNELRAPWPPALQNIRRDLQPFQTGATEGPGVAATFVFQDEMATGPAGEDAYALFILGEPLRAGLQRTFTWYRPAATEGKGVPRLFSWMDWDRDGRDEMLLEVFGARANWWAALGRSEDGTWAVSFEDSCSGLEPPS